MRIAIATDAWFPQVNGVVRTLAATVEELERRDYEVALVSPDNFLTLPMPGYASIRLAVAPRFGRPPRLGEARSSSSGSEYVMGGGDEDKDRDRDR